MGGQLSVKSVLGEGSTFSLVFPFLLPAPSAERPSSSVGSSSRAISEYALRQQSGRAGPGSSTSERSNLNDLMSAMTTSGAGIGDEKQEGRHQFRRKSASNPSNPSSRSFQSHSPPSSFGGAGTGPSSSGRQSARGDRVGVLSVTDSQQPIRPARVQSPSSPISSSATPSRPFGRPPSIDAARLEQGHSSTSSLSRPSHEAGTTKKIEPLPSSPQHQVQPSSVLPPVVFSTSMPPLVVEGRPSTRFRVLVVEDEVCPFSSFSLCRFFVSHIDPHSRAARQPHHHL
jgi:hypothetical protein